MIDPDDVIFYISASNARRSAGARLPSITPRPGPIADAQKTLAVSGHIDLLAPGPGQWVFSYDAPVNGLLTVAGTTTPAQTGLSGCQSADGCFVASVAATVAGTRMIGNPFPYAVDPSDPTYEDLFTTAEASPLG